MSGHAGQHCCSRIYAHADNKHYLWNDNKTQWRTGRKVGRTIYDENDNLIGVMDTAVLAGRVVDAVNKTQ